MNLNSIPLGLLALIAGLMLLARLKYRAWRGTDQAVMAEILH